MNNLIACQPSAIKAVRLQCLVPPHPEKITIRDLLGKDEVYHLIVCTLVNKLRHIYTIYDNFSLWLSFLYMWLFVCGTIVVYECSHTHRSIWHSKGEFVTCKQAFSQVNVIITVTTTKCINLNHHWFLFNVFLQRSRVDTLLEDELNLTTNRILS